MSKVAFCASGGSTKIIIHVGAYKALVDNDVEITRVYGTSAGSIVAACIAAGYTVEELEKIIFKTDFKKFLKQSFFEYIYNFFYRSGLVSGSYKFNYLKALFKGLTFRDLKIDLNVVGHSLTKNTWVVFNKRTCPDMSVATAVHISSSIPVVFAPVKYYCPRAKKYDWYVDGGLSKNFPLDLIRGQKYIGHVLDGREDHDWEKVSSLKMFSVSFSQIIKSNVEEAIRDSHKDGLIVKSKWQKSMVDFNVPYKEKKKMLEYGYKNMSDALKTWLVKQKRLY